jgi:hypothetical protein
VWNTIFICLNIRELQRLKITSRPPTPHLGSSQHTTTTTAATKGQRGMLFMHACYLLYTVGPVLQGVTQNTSTILSYIAMILAASKGVLNVAAVNEGRVRRLAGRLYP